MKINDIPVAIPEFLEMVAVIRPRPTELRENNAINKNARKIPNIFVLGVKPNGKASK